MIEAVIFDIGNVLITWQPEEFYDKEIGVERRKEMFAQLDLHGMNDAVDRGGDFKQTIYDFADQNPAWGDEIRMWHDRWLELAYPVIEPSVHLLRRLRAKNIPVFALTNFGIDSFKLAQQTFDFLNEFDRYYVSGHMQVIKPDTTIYAMVEADCSVAPEKLLFTDDRAENIAAAGARGWQTHQFTSPQGWAACLQQHGLLTAAEAEV